MLPRALLFSPDEATSATLQEALSALGCEVAHCCDIFAAIERLTNYSFRVLVVDWREELEAAFLLKTARELKSNRDSFALALVDPQQALPTDIQANGMLVKPVTTEGVCSALSSILGNPTLRTPTPTVPVGRPENAGVADFLQQDPLRRSRTSVLVPSIKSAKPHLFLSAPARPLPKPVSRITALASVLWPAVIAASLFAFDQWPNIRQHEFTRPTREAFSRLHRRVQRVFQRNSPPVALEDSAIRTPLPPAGSSDLLADYSQPVPQLAVNENNSPSPRAAVPDVDVASLQALPVFQRIPQTPARLWIQRTAANPDIPSSLRYPPPFATVPGLHKAGEWDPNTITLPELAARALLEKEVFPSYPQSALRAGIDNAVVLLALVADDGTIRDLKLIRGQMVLARAAFDAVKQWRFRPYQRNGKAVDVQTLITIDFKRPS
jgi:TonB family protein